MLTHDSPYLTPEETLVARRAAQLLEDPSPEAISDEERLAMRAFLQRGETRLSTYQRVAGVFLNGAGLLILLPGLSREAMFGMVQFVLSGAYFLLIPWILSAAVPILAFWLLLEDLVKFYFSPRFLQDDPIQVTRFSLAGITFPNDEGVECKAQVMAITGSNPSYAHFMQSGTSKTTIKNARETSANGRTSSPLRVELARALDQGQRSEGSTQVVDTGVVLSLAGSLDLSLTQEVARMEASIARHVLLLRRLVLRYVKALLIFVWTTLGTLAAAAVIGTEVTSFTPANKADAVLGIYAILAAGSAFLVRQPIRWIESLVPRAERRGHNAFRDHDLLRFEKMVIGASLLGFGACVWAALQLRGLI